MAIKFSCPKCGKKFSVKDTSRGKSGKCPCGAVIRIPSTKASISELLENNTIIKNGATICVKCLKTIKKGESREIINEQVYCVDCASRATSVATAYTQGPTSAGDHAQTSSLSKGALLTEERVRKSFYSRLIGFSIGTLIVTIFLFFKHGKVAAIAGLIIGVIFTITSCRHLLSYDRKLAKDKVTYEQQKAKLRLSKKPQTIVASIAFLLIAFLGLFFAWDRFFNQEKCWESFWNFMVENIGVKIILLIVNIPIFIFIGKWMGGWELLWRLFKFRLKCNWLPFFIFTKKHWEFYETVNFEKLIQALAVPFVCLMVYLVEYTIIKLFFLG